jgi:hypothetical protein
MEIFMENRALTACLLQEQLINFELAYINTNHPDFVDIGQVLGTTFVGQDPPVAAPRQQPPAPQQQPVRRYTMP